MEKLGTTARDWQENLMFTPEERQTMRAAAFLQGFLHRHEFVQTLAPIDLEF
jgi:hypothetical protein